MMKPQASQSRAMFEIKRGSIVPQADMPDCRFDSQPAALARKILETFDLVEVINLPARRQNCGDVRARMFQR